MWLTATIGLLTAITPNAGVRLEAERGVAQGATISQARAGFSGNGYLTGFEAEGARVEWKVDLPPGIYTVTVRFATPGGPKRSEIEVDGRRLEFALPDTKGAFDSIRAGRIEITKRDSSVSVLRGWGYFDLDSVEIAPAAPPAPLKAVPDQLSTPRPSREARALFRRLRAAYGKATLSGQYEINESDWVRDKTKQTPAVLGGDFMDYSPSRLEFGADPKDATERYIAAAKKGQILTLSWHWNAPKDLINEMQKDANGQERNRLWYRGFYTDATTFDVAAALADPNGEGYRLLIRDIDAIAVQLKKLQAARVPVLWRPLHEADGRWFWWGAKGPEPCIKLWRLMHDRLTNHHRLDNLIWVWNSADPAWYPGHDTVDIMSVDVYPSDRQDSLSGIWDELVEQYDGKKMLALAEFPGAPDVDRMFRFGVRWSYFVSWTGSVGPKSTPEDLLLRTYRSRNVLNLGEKP